MDLSSGAGLPVVQSVTTPTIIPNTGSGNNIIPFSSTTPSSTPLPLELHIDEDGCLAHTSLAGSTVVIASSRTLQYSQIHQIDDGNSVTSEISNMESLSISSSIEPPSQPEVNSPTNVLVTKVLSKVSSPLDKSSSPIAVGGSLSPVSFTKTSSPVETSKSPSPVAVPVNPSLSGAKSPSPSDLKCSSLIQSSCPVAKRDGPVPVNHSPEPKSTSPVTVPWLSIPVPKSDSPVRDTSSPVTDPKTASPVTVPRLSSPALKCVSPFQVPNISSIEILPKNASPETVPKSASPVAVPNISSSATVLKNSRSDTLPKYAGPVILPKLSSPVTVPMNETVANRPALATKKTYTIASTSSPRASPGQHGAVQSSNLSSPPSDKQEGEIIDLTWPYRDPLLDDALDKLLSPSSPQLMENQSPLLGIPGDEDRSWDEEDGIYPELSPEGTLTPMTESSWMDECFTPSTCPGTPDATLDLPIQQPSAVERLSASGQVGRSP